MAPKRPRPVHPQIVAEQAAALKKLTTRNFDTETLGALMQVPPGGIQSGRQFKKRETPEE